MKSHGLALGGSISGALSLLLLAVVILYFGWMWLLVLTVVLGVVALVLGIIALKRGQSRVLSIVAIVLGALAALASIAFVGFLIALVGAFVLGGPW